MVFKTATLTNGNTVFIRQRIVFFDILTASETGIDYQSIHISTPEMKAFLDSIAKDSVKSSTEDAWDIVTEACKLF